ncbi:condensation domain-containing protein, partial [Streptomyces tendae]|uniref:condensation domain-containing protein n=1 Tax=Streptomyces tendae TaxID=1932 RepID=UPI001671E5EB
MNASETRHRQLSAAQTDIWLASQIFDSSAAYNIAEYIEIHGAVDADIFEQAYRQTLRDFDSLRIRLREGEDGPYQIVADPDDVEWSLMVFDFTAEADPEVAARRVMLEDLHRAKDILRDPLFTSFLVKISEAKFIWYHGYHHIIVDGSSGQLIAARVSDVYTALMRGITPPAVGNSTLDTILDHDAEYRSSKDFELDQQHWLGRLDGGADVVSFTERAGSGTPARFLREVHYVSQEKLNHYRTTARLAGTSWSGLIIAATAGYLHHLTGEKELFLGLPVAARAGKAVRQAVGMVSNQLPLAVQVRPDMTVSDLLVGVKNEIRQLLRHQRYRNEDIRRSLKMSDNGQRLFGPTVNIMSLDYGKLAFDGHPLTPNNLSNGPVDDFAINVFERGDGNGLEIAFDANPALYSQDEVAAHGKRFLRYLEAFAADIQSPVGRVRSLAPEERAQILGEWNNTARPLTQGTVNDVFAARVAQTPHAPAVMCEDEVLTYAELELLSNRLAHHLINLGIGGEDRVAVLQERSLGLVISILAIVKAGAAYVPLDARAPESRLRLMMADTRASVLLTDHASAHVSFVHDAQVIVVDESLLREDTPAPRPEVSVHGQQLLCVMYTSGSTGVPKGVGTTHRDVVSLGLDEWWRSGSHARVLFHSPQAFDASTYELWVPLLSGGSVVVA